MCVLSHGSLSARDGRMSACRMAKRTMAIPTDLALRDGRGAEKNGITGNPALVLEKERERQSELRIAGTAGDPIDLHVMRAGCHPHRPNTHLRRIGNRLR